jgi:putative transcriptional regulator
MAGSSPAMTRNGQNNAGRYKECTIRRLDLVHRRRGLCSLLHNEITLNKMRELRAVRGWRQADLADTLNVSRQTVNAIETGRYDPSLPPAFAVAKLFRLKIEEIFQPQG